MSSSEYPHIAISDYCSLNKNPILNQSILEILKSLFMESKSSSNNSNISSSNYENIAKLIKQITIPQLRINILSMFILVHNEALNFSNEKFLDVLKYFLYKISNCLNDLMDYPSDLNRINVNLSLDIFFLLIATFIQKIFHIIDIQIQPSKKIENELTKLYLLYYTLNWTSQIIIAIDYTSKIMHEKNYYNEQFSISDKNLFQSNRNKSIFIYFQVFTDLFYLVKEYKINQNLLSNYPFFSKCDNKFIINFEELNKNIESLYHLFNENMMVNYGNYTLFISELYLGIEKNNKNSVICHMVYILDNYLYLKFRHKDLNKDINSYYKSYPDYIFNILDIINKEILSKINSFFTLIHEKKSLKLLVIKIDYNNINKFILNEYYKLLKDFIVCHMIACFNNDSLSDFITKNTWLKPVLDSYVFCYFYIVIIRIIEEYNVKNQLINIDNDDTIFSQITSELFIEFTRFLNRNNIIMPIRLMFYKETIIISCLLLFYAFICVFKDDINCIKKSKNMHKILSSGEDINTYCDKLLIILKDIHDTHNTFSFFITELLFRALNSQDNLLIFTDDNKENNIQNSIIPHMRIYTNTENILEYYDLNLFQIKKMELNSEFPNYKYYYDLPLNYVNKMKNYSSVTGDIKLEIDENSNKNYICSISSFIDFNPAIVIIDSNNKFINNYTIGDWMNNLMKKLGGYEFMIGLFKGICTVKELADIIVNAFLKGPGNDEGGIVKKNLDACLRYYDGKCEMEYFEFMEKVKDFVV